MPARLVQPIPGASRLAPAEPGLQLGKERARPLLLLASRELTLLWRSRGARGILALLIGVAWLPPILIPFRAGSLGIGSFREVTMLALGLDQVVLPLIALIAGADLLAGEIEDGTLIPVVTLPISRSTCFVGKCIGRWSFLKAAELTAFASAAAAIAIVRGIDGWLDYAIVVVAALFLSAACFAIGTALGAFGRARTRAFGSAIVAWLVMVFAADAALLAAAWLMALDPVDLFRLSALALAPNLHARMTASLGSLQADWLSLGAGWLLWIALPLGVGLRRFTHAVLR